MEPAVVLLSSIVVSLTCTVIILLSAVGCWFFCFCLHLLYKALSTLNSQFIHPFQRKGAKNLAPKQFQANHLHPLNQLLLIINYQLLIKIPPLYTMTITTKKIHFVIKNNLPLSKKKKYQCSRKLLF